MEEFTTLITSIGQLLGTDLAQVRLTFFYRCCLTGGLALCVSGQATKAGSKIKCTKAIRKLAIMP